MYLANGMKKRKMSSSTTAWMMPAIGVRPPLLMLVIVRAMAPVAGMPPKSGEARLATPCATSSVLELWWSPMTPSATVADSSDSMAPSTAMVIAGATRLFIVSHVITGTCTSGMALLTLKRSPMVSMLVMPAYCFRSRAAMVITMIATSEPGIFLLNFGVMAMIITLTTPTNEHQRSAVEKCCM